MTDPIDIEVLLAQAGWMRQLALNLLHDPHSAEDVVQETWLRALRDPPRGAGEIRSLRKWLGTVARRIALRRLESEAARQRRESVVARPELDFDTEAVAERLRLQQTLAKHVLELPEQLRTAVLLRYQEELSPGELAQRLGIRNAAARQRVSRGLAALREKFDRENGGDRERWNRALSLLALPPGMLRSSLATGGAGWSARLAIGSVSVALVALVVGTVWWLGRTTAVPDATARIATTPPSAPAESAAAATDRRPMSPPAAPTPAAVDPSLDLHGRVVDASGSPVGGAVVIATRPRRAAFSLIAPLQETPATGARRTHTDARGEFALRLAAEGMFDLVVEADGFATADLPLRRPGEQVLVRLEPPVTIRGTVQRATGGTAVGARLRLDRDHGAHGFRVVAATVVGADGQYRFDAVPRGRFILHGAIPGGTTLAAVLETGTAAAVVQDLTFPAGHPLRGKVEDGAGRPVAGVSVCVAAANLVGSGTRPPISPRSLGLDWWGQTAVESDAAGRFKVTVPDRFFKSQLLVQAPGYARQQILLQAAQDQVLIRLGPGYAVRGCCRDPSGRPIADAAVSALGQAADGTMIHSDFRFVRTDAAGRFELGDLRPDLRHVLALQKPGFGDGFELISDGAGATLELGDVQLAPAAAILGTVVGPDGRPQPDRYVYSTPTTVEERAQAEFTQPGVLPGLPGLGRRVQRTDDRGRFRLDGLAGGEHRLRVVASEAGPPAVVVLRRGETRADVRLTTSGQAIAGRVTDARGEPVVQAAVVLFAKDPPVKQARATTLDGSFRFELVPPGVYSLRIAPNSIHTRHGNRMVHAIDRRGIRPGNVQVAVILPPAIPIRGLVVDAADQPVANQLVFARDVRGHRPRRPVPAPGQEGRSLILGACYPNAGLVSVIGAVQRVRPGPWNDRKSRFS